MSLITSTASLTSCALRIFAPFMIAIVFRTVVPFCDPMTEQNLRQFGIADDLQFPAGVVLRCVDKIQGRHEVRVREAILTITALAEKYGGGSPISPP